MGKRLAKLVVGTALVGLALICPAQIVGNLLAGMIGTALVGRELLHAWRNWLARRSMLAMDQPTVVPVRGGVVVFEEDGRRITSRFLAT